MATRERRLRGLVLNKRASWGVRPSPLCVIELTGPLYRSEAGTSSTLDSGGDEENEESTLFGGVAKLGLAEAYIE